jgi:hypothetical protein
VNDSALNDGALCCCLAAGALFLCLSSSAA